MIWFFNAIDHNNVGFKQSGAAGYQKGLTPTDSTFYSKGNLPMGHPFYPPIPLYQENVMSEGAFKDKCFICA